MKIDLILAKVEDQAMIQNLARFYVYEMSRYCGLLLDWKTPSNGLYECDDLSRYWNEPNRYPFLILVDNEIAGFALINKIGSSEDVDWNMGEFFILAKFQSKGIGRRAATQVFDQFHGTWEVMQIPENKGAIDFWQKVVCDYTHHRFESCLKIIDEPKPHPMVVLKFCSHIKN